MKSDLNRYEKMYFTLFNQITDALDALNAQNYGQASEILRSAQQQAEEQYIQETQPQ